MRIRQLTLFASDLAVLHAFYVGILGLLEVKPPGPEDNSFSVQVGATTLIFLQAAPDWQGRYHLAFGIPTGLFQASREWLAQRARALTGLSGEN